MIHSKYQPADVFEELTKEVGQLFKGTLSDVVNTASGSSAGTWVPAIDIREEANRFVVEVDIPGVAAKEVELTFENGVLTIEGSREKQETEENVSLFRSERKHGTFLRRLSLPELVDDEKISASGKDGVLTILLPKKEKVQPKKIQVD